MSSRQIEIVQVWNNNLEQELKHIHCKLSAYRYVSLDTEFPGTIFQLPDTKTYSRLSSETYYLLIKKNVDELQLIQLGLTLSDPERGRIYKTWQFNFRDFDPDKHLHNSDSISLLSRQGIDFYENRENGIDSTTFAELFDMFVLSPRFLTSPTRLTWITFQGSYDFALMVKILTGGKLPDDYRVFSDLERFYFGERCIDLKHVMGSIIHGGLEKVAETLGLERIAGKRHQAGSDSLLTMQVFHECVRRILNVPELLEKQNMKIDDFDVAEGTLAESVVPAVTKALEEVEGISDLKLRVLEGIASVELTKQTTVQATGVASSLVEVIQGSGFKLQTLNLSFEDEKDK